MIFVYIYVYIYVCVCVYIYICGYNSFYSQRVSLVPLHPEMFTNIYIWGQAIFSHINYFLNQGRIFKPGIQFWHKMFTLKSYNLSIETHFLYGSLWTHPVHSPVHSESSVMYRLHGNVMIHILHSVPSATLSWEVQVRRAVLECCFFLLWIVGVF